MITANYIHDILRSGTDGGGIYTLGYQSKASGSTNSYASLIDSNYIANSGDGLHYGIYLDNGSQNWQASNNVLYQLANTTLLDYSSGETASVNNTGVTNVTDPSQNPTVVQNAGLEAAYAYLDGTASRTNLAQGTGVTVSASDVYQNNAAYNGAKAIDGNDTTRWTTDLGATPASPITLTVTFPTATAVNRTQLLEDQYLGANQTGSIDDYSIRYLDTNGVWQTACSNSYPGPVQTDTFPTITTTQLRLTISNSSGVFAVKRIRGLRRHPVTR